MNKDKENTTYNNHIYLKIKSTGPYYEHISQFKSSLYKSTYERAFLQLDDIINNFKRIMKGYHSL